MINKELREKLEQFPDDLIIMIPDASWNPDASWLPFVTATNVAQGFNEFDGCLFIDDSVEDE